MKINKITVVDNIITISLDSESSAITKVYIDSLNNGINKYAVEDTKHDYAVADIVKTGNDIIIDINKLQPELDLSAFTITIGGVLGFYFDDKELYYKQVDTLISYCSSCLDTQQKEFMVTCSMRQELFFYALRHDLTEDAISHYIDLARLLKIDTKKNMLGLCSGSCNRVTNPNCVGGTCALC